MTIGHYPTPMQKQRARSAADKQARQQQILDAAATLLADRPFQDITMSLLAKQAGLSKGTSYLYFRTKEEVFLALVEIDLSDWLSGLAAALPPGTPQAPAQVAALLADSLSSRPRLLSLLGILHSVLEENLSPEVALQFKSSLKTLLLQGGALLEGALPGLPPGQGTRMFLWMHALLIGLTQMSRTSAGVTQALRHPDLALLRIHARSELELAFAAILRDSCAPQ